MRERIRRLWCRLFGHGWHRRQAWVDKMCRCRVRFCGRCQTLLVENVSLTQAAVVSVSFEQDEHGRVVGMPLVSVRGVDE